MATFGPGIVGDVLSACEAGATEAAEAFGRALDAQLELAVGKAGGFDAKTFPAGFGGPGLAVVLTVGPSAALVLVPESTGLVPSWCASPDATGQSKLTTLAQELGMILLPEQFVPDDYKAAWVKTLAGAVIRGGVSTGAATISLKLTGPEGKQGVATLLWPAANPSAVLGAAAGQPKDKPGPAAKRKAGPGAPLAKKPAAPGPAGGPHGAPSAGGLPCYTRSLLRVKIPVIVTLARKRQPLDWILGLGPGSIIHFDKSCEEMLDLDAGGHPIASGEAVKVGDKFGLRITSVRLPDERFQSIRKERS